MALNNVSGLCVHCDEIFKRARRSRYSNWKKTQTKRQRRPLIHARTRSCGLGVTASGQNFNFLPENGQTSLGTSATPAATFVLFPGPLCFWRLLEMVITCLVPSDARAFVRVACIKTTAKFMFKHCGTGASPPCGRYEPVCVPPQFTSQAMDVDLVTDELPHHTLCPPSPPYGDARWRGSERILGDLRQCRYCRNCGR